MDNNRPLFDRRTLVAMLLAFGVMQAWFWFAGSREPQASVDTDAATTAGAPPVANAPPSAPPVAPPAAPPVIADAPIRTLPLEVCNNAALISTEGGGMQAVRLLDYKADYHVMPIWSWLLTLVTGPRQAWVPYDLDVGPAQMVSEKGQFLTLGSGGIEAAAPRLEVDTETKGKIVLHGVTADGLAVSRTFEGRPDCTIDISTTWTNPGPNKYTGVEWLAFHDELTGAVTSAGRSVPRPVAILDKRRTWDVVEGPPVEVGGPARVIGLEDHYFAAVALVEEGDVGRLFTSERRAGETKLFGVTLAYSKELGVNESLTRKHQLYVGPQSSTAMTAVHPDLADVIDQGWFGWFAFFGAPVLFVLKLLHGWTGSWGTGIVLLTIFFKTIFFPLTASAFKSGLKMQAIQPKLAALREELKENPEELNRRTMAMFSQNGVSPVGGCLPSLAQVPVWMALGSVLTFSVELYHSSFLVWKDLAAPDPYAVLPVSVMVLQFLLQRLMPTAPGMDPAQARMMQWMPVFLAFLYFNLPAGLMVYIFCNLLLTIVQQLIMKRIYHPPVLPA